MTFLLLTTDEYNNLKDLLEKDRWFTMKIDQAKYQVPALDIWEVTFDRELTPHEAFDIGKKI
jgi:hypothetical protein